MTPARFLETRTPVWNRLAELIRQAGRKGAKGLSGEALHELVRLYPAVAVDVARARMYGIDEATRQRINDLAIAAHGMLYRRRHVRPLRAIGRFFREGYPRLFRRLWPYMTVAVALFAVAAVGAYAAVRARPSIAYQLVPQGLDVGESRRVSAEDVSERYRRMPKPMMAGMITTNNIQVAFLAFALGITAGIGTGYVLLVNSVMLGTFFGHFANNGLSYECYSFLVPHGALEIFAILVAGAAGLRLGLSLAVPGDRTRRASLTHGAREAVALLLGTIPMFVVAGAIESFVTPSYISGGAKIATGLSVWGLFMAYLLLVGREDLPAPAPADTAAI